MSREEGATQPPPFLALSFGLEAHTQESLEDRPFEPTHGLEVDRLELPVEGVELFFDGLFQFFRRTGAC